MSLRLFSSFRFFRYLLFEALPFVFLTLLVLTVLILAQQITRQSELLFNSTTSALLSFRIISHLLPGIMVITLPFSLLIGSLMALNRLSADNEIIAARASGISLFQITQPLLLCGLVGVSLSGFLTLRVIPSLLTSAKGLRSELILSILAAPIKPQTFNTQFPHHLVYTRDIDQTTGDWLGVFIIRNADQGQSLVLTARRGKLRITQTAPLILEIELTDGLLLTTLSTEPQKQTLTSFQQQEIKLSSENPAIAHALDKERNAQELSLQQLSTRSATANTVQERRQAGVEWHKRFSLPFACLILIILAIPLGLTTSRQTGRAVAFTIGFAIAVLYYLSLIAGQNFALSGTLPAWLGVWMPNLLGLLIAVLHFASWPTEQRKAPSDNPLKRMLRRHQDTWRSQSFQRPVFLSLINYLLISELLKYFLISLTILVVTSLIFTLFDLLPSLNRSGLGWQYSSIYLLFLTPQIAYYVSPFALLLAVLTAHGVLSRSNQITALMTTGQSVTRLSCPLTLCILTIIAGSFWASEAILPLANREQDARYNLIKGKKIEQSVLALGRYWVRGADERIYGFQISNPANTLLNTTAYRISNVTGKLQELLYIQEASAVNERIWRVGQGWRYEVDKQNHLSYQVLPLKSPDDSHNFLMIPEGASLFRRIVNEAAKMTFQDLRSHIRYLSQIGATTASLRVDLEKKLAFPFSSIPLIVLAFPLAFKNSRRGTLAGVGLSIIVGFTFWITASFIEGLGRQSYLPPGLSVWGTQALFLTLGIFLIFRLRN